MSSKFENKINLQIEKLQKEVNSLNKVKQLLNTYPDLTEHSDRWRNTYYSSTSVNKHVDQVDFKYACGCCSDAPLLAYFYKIEDGIKIYSNPYSICIGEQNASGFGAFENNNWKQTLRELNISSDMEIKVKEYFLANPPENFDDNDEDF